MSRNNYIHTLKLSRYSVLVTFPVAVIKHHDKINLWGNGFILSPSSMVKPIMEGKSKWQRSVAHNYITPTIRKETVQNECCFVHVYSLGCPLERGTTHIGGLPTSVNVIKIIPPRLISKVSLDSVKLTINTSHYIGAWKKLQRIPRE